MFSSVRGRISLMATAVVALTLLAASLLILRMVEADLIDTTERALAAELELDASEFDQDLGPFFEFEVDGQVLSLGVFIEDDFIAIGSLFDEFGNQVADVVIDNQQFEVIELIDPFNGAPFADPVLTAEIEALNFDARDIDGDEGNMLIVGAVARDEVDQSLQAVRQALLLIVPLFTALMGVLIWWLVGRALQPVQAISTQVEAISTTNLDQRVPVPRGNDAVADLATVMNGMLTRLEHGDERQRQFAADASHELRSPLSTVRAAAEMITHRPASGRAPELAADIVAEADRMEALIADLLALSRLDENGAGPAHTNVDFSELAASISDVSTKIEPAIVVHGDERQLDRLITNLVNNARRHATQAVLISLRTVSSGETLLAELRVEDDGQGVPAERRTTIFERFSRLDEARSRDQGGAGLGLALVQAIAVRHHGRVFVDDSTELGGAAFIVQLPIAT